MSSTLEQIYGGLVGDVVPILGLSAAQVAAEEDPERISVQVYRVDASRLRQLDGERLERWSVLFGRALEIEVSFEDGSERGVWKLDVRGAGGFDVQVTALGHLLDDAESRIAARQKLSLTLEKAPLVERLRTVLEGESPGKVHEVELSLFLFASAFERAVARRDELDFEYTFLGVDSEGPGDDGPKALLVLLGDETGYLTGPYLAVLGSEETVRASDFVGGLGSLEPLRQALKRMKSCQWDDRTHALTPSALAITERDGLDGCRAQLTRLMNRLVLPFLANVTERSPGQELVCVFKGERREQRLAIGEESTSTDLYQLYDWVYRHPEEATSRMAIVRRLIAGKEWLPKADFALLVANAKSLVEQCVYQLHLLIGDNVFETFQERQKIADRIRAYTDGVSERIRSLSKEIVDNTYRTVGLLVAVALAYILDPKLEPTVTIVLIGLYVLYLVFVYFFYVSALRSDFEQKRVEFEHEKSRLAEEKVGALDELFAGVAEREKEFTARLRVVRGVYVSLVALAVLLGLWLTAGHAPDPEDPTDMVRTSGFSLRAG